MGINEPRVTPTTIEALERVLAIAWSDGSRSELAYTLLRRSCRCAQCIEEMTGRALLDPATIPEGIHPTDIRAIGRYAFQFAWSDGHTTGIYTYELLRALASAR